MNSTLIEARTKKGLTQREVAEKAKITLRAYQYYEKGEREPSASIGVRIAKALKTTSERLFGD